MVLFEAAQQYYYILQFDLADPQQVSFGELVQGQFFRWIFWLIYACILWWFVGEYPIEKDQLSKRQIGLYAGVLGALMLLNLGSISAFQFVLNEEVFTLKTLGDNFVFYTFQKSPIYLLAYTAVLLIAHYNINVESLEVRLQQLSKLKETNTSLYEELKKKAYADTAKLIQVKIGNRTKMVPLDAIIWIEADDYCVKIHDDSGHTHTIRSSMKALERELPMAFIRIHRKAIVNKKAIVEWHLGDEACAMLNNGTQIPISQSRLKKLKSQFGEISLALKTE
jgi:DNA-binding LytR/AlgR family response regulator